MIVVDNETTGTKPHQSSLLTTGALFLQELKDRFLVVGEFYDECRMRDGAIIEGPNHKWPGDPGAFAVNGYTEERARDPKKQSLEELAKKFVDWSFSMVDKAREADVTSYPVNMSFGGNNVGFDAAFLMDSLERAKIVWPFGYRHIDLLPLIFENHIRRGIPIPTKDNRIKITSDYNFRYVGLPSEPEPHHGLTGAKFTAEALSRMLYGKQLLDEFKQYPIPKFLERTS